MIVNHSINIVVELMLFSVFINDLFLCNKKAVKMKQMITLSTFCFHGSQDQVILNLFNDFGTIQKLFLSDNLMSH